MALVMLVIEEYSMNFKDREVQTLLMVTIRICTIGRTNAFYRIRENLLADIECSPTCSGIREDHRLELKTLALNLRMECVDIPGFQYWLVVLAGHYVCYVRESPSSPLFFLPLADLPGKGRSALYVLLTSPFLFLIYSLCSFLERGHH